jgi:ABC-type antimicrobial peptide transport system permease subunit
MAYSVSRREREFGIRIALGASRSRILRLLYSMVLRLVLSGTVLGVILAYFAQVWVASMLEIKEITLWRSLREDCCCAPLPDSRLLRRLVAPCAWFLCRHSETNENIRRN